ncbi:hypothetical protein ONA92_02000 [Mycobacteroides salmoniphilum]|uniref:hypothetical protein n=1 Tax=Mycobacteroides salmoniphilum TaxID=404941 RepID=UPI003564E74B
MTEYSAGEAKLRVAPDASEFKAKLEADMRKIRAEFTVNVNAATAQARADIERFRDAQERGAISVGVDAALGQAQADMRRFRAEQEANHVTVRVDADTRSARREIEELRRSATHGSLGSAFAWNAGAAGLSLLPSAATGLVSLAGALQQVAQSGIAVPGILGGIGASVGTLVLGLSGVKDAYTAAADAAGKFGADGAQLSQQATAAANALRNAVYDEARAQRDVAQARKDARQQLQDLNLELRGGRISEAQAVLAAHRARRDLQSGQYKDALDYQEAQLRVVAADQRVMETRARNAELQDKTNDANTKGVENSDLVVDAQERLVRAHQGTQQAQAASIASTVAAAAALNNLAPNAAEFVKTLVGMREQFRGLRTDVQQALFAGLSDEIKTLVENDLPILDRGLTNVATGINQNFAQLLRSLGSEQSQGLLDRILGNTGEAQKRFTAAIDPIVHSIGTLTGGSSDALPRIADGIGKVAERFDHFITEADKDGRLAKWIDEGIDGFTSMGNTVLNVGGIFTALTKAAGGGGLLGTLEQNSKKLADFLNSTKGQDQLRKFFADARAELDKWAPILRDLPGMISGVVSGAQEGAGVVLGVLRPITAILGEHPQLVKDIALAFLIWKTVPPLVGGVTNSLGALSRGITEVGTGFSGTRDRITRGMDAVDERFTAAGSERGGVRRFSRALAGISAAGGPLSLLVTAGIPLVAQFVTRITQDMDNAADHIKAVNEEAKSLIGTLETVTNLTGTATRKALADKLQSAQGGPGKGLGGDALNAAKLLGIGGPDQRDVITAALPGGNTQYDQVMGPIRDKVRPAVQDFIKSQGLTLGQGKLQGIDENTIVDAWLGVPEALEKVTNAKELGQNIIQLGTLQSQVENLGQADPTFLASLLGQRLNFERSGTGGAVSKAQSAQAAATPQPRLKPEFTSQFPGAVVNSDGTTTTIVSTIPPNAGMGLGEQSQATQGVPPNQDKWTYRLSPEDARRLTFEKGGFTPGHTGTGPTGGHVAEVHKKEFVVSERGTANVPAPFLHALNAGIVDPTLLPKYDQGGYVDPEGNPIVQGPPPGAAPVAPIAPAPTGGGLLSAVGTAVNGISGPINNITGALGNLGGGKGAQSVQIPGLGLSIPTGGFTAPTLESWMPWLPKPGQDMSTYNPFAGAPDKIQPQNIAFRGASTLIGGALSGLGLDNSILSQNNPYNQAAQKSAQFYLDKFSGGGGQADAGVAAVIEAANSGAAQLPSATGLPVPGADGTFSPAALRAIQYAQQHAVGQKYVYGGTGAQQYEGGPGGYDCSGIASAVYAASKGLPQGQRYFTTESDFAALGFVPGYKSGELNIGVMRGGGGPNSHMALTLPNGIKVESGGAADATQYGGAAKGATDFALQWHLPVSSDTKGSVPGLYDIGGWLQPGLQTVVNKTSAPEPVLNAQQWSTASKAIDMVSSARPTPPQPPMSGAQGGISSGGIQPYNPTQKPASSPPPSAAPTSPASPSTLQPPESAPEQAPSQQQGPTFAPGTVGAAPSSLNHNLPAIDKAIDSTASTLANLASTAISAAAAGGSMGMGGGAGGALASSMVAGGIQQAGKIAKNVANVGSSLLVGSVPGSNGTTDRAYGELLRPAQNAPITAPTYAPSYHVSGNYELRSALDQLELKEKVNAQAQLANKP